MNKVKKDKKIRQAYLKTHQISLLTSILSKNKILTLKTREKWLFDSSVKFSTRYKNYCLVTGRARGVFPSLHVSRIVFKAHADLGQIPGIRTASW